MQENLYLINKELVPSLNNLLPFLYAIKMSTNQDDNFVEVAKVDEIFYCK